MPRAHLARRARWIRPVEDMEVSLVRACLDSPGWLSRRDEARMRYALNLARLTEVRTSDGRDVDLTEALAPFRERLVETLSPLLLDRRGEVEQPEVAFLVPRVWELAQDVRDRLRRTTRDRLDWEDVEREIRHKALVVVAGGGGGVGYVYLGAFHALEERGLTPDLIAGASMGAVLGAFRARHRRFDATQVTEVMRALAWPQLFRPISLQSRFGLPGPLRLYLREALGRFFRHEDGSVLQIGDLDIPLLLTVTGIRRGELPHAPEWYERGLGLDLSGRRNLLGIRGTRRVVTRLFRILLDFVRRPEMLRSLVLGGDDTTRTFDLLDALGFSSAVPAVIHYDLAREDPRMEALLEDLMERRDVGRLIDGGVADNVPARAAWRAVQSGAIGKRNALVVAFDAFAPKLTAPLWIPIQRLAGMNVRPSMRYAHVPLTFVRTLSPLELLPNEPHLLRAMRSGREETAWRVPLIERLMAPIEDDRGGV